MGDGHCLDCVKADWERYDKLRQAVYDAQQMLLELETYVVVRDQAAIINDTLKRGLSDE